MERWKVDHKAGRVRVFTDKRRNDALYLRWFERGRDHKLKVGDDPGRGASELTPTIKRERAALESEGFRRGYAKDKHISDVKAGLAPGNDPYAELLPILTDFLRWKVGRGVEPARIETLRRTSLAAWGHMGWTKVADISRRDLERYLDYLRDTLHLSARTQNRHQCDIASPFRWAEKENRIGRNPLRNMDAREGPEVRMRRVFTEDEMLRIFQAASDGPAWQFPAIAMGYYGALRLREVRNMTWGRANLEQETFQFRDTDQKNKKPATIAMAPELVVILTTIKHKAEVDGTPVDGATKILEMPATPSYAWKQCVTRAGLSRVIDGKLSTKNSQGHVGDFHALRHTRLTHLAAMGWLLTALQDFARHSDPKITRKYVHEDQAAVRDGLRRSAEKSGRDLAQDDEEPCGATA